MNYLAHLYLSGSEPGVKVGNFIGDYVKGKRYQRYSPAIQKGILLHRRIDSFTDKHPQLRESAKMFKPEYGRYSGVVMDVVYDHFLAVNWARYSDVSLRKFVSESHKILMRYYFSLPGVVKQFLPFLIHSRRMEQYQYLEGVEKTLKVMAGHTSLPDHSQWAVNQLSICYNELQESFFQVFADTMVMADDYLNVQPVNNCA
ncbi:acyl carrier protein phosphodiesterase [Alkalitalea saponilacus]|uniref:Acyl carrier protein phosphodiesterase n=1 Tax=Alkalitalea saponilacus TaxID=889453 RepID=A0A1T5AGB9_9BACT|nr:ACP phosphodiesterase [Alkalitalea saponilacus]ASB48709.1 ACP phosphodiesterase [Alkalitalea saponilacus]SKB34051.1 Acyl carrier protein phosphodiesterase [Alkalitalea saponilacus]